MKKKYNPDKRVNFIHVRMTDEEYMLFLEQVEQTEMTKSEYIRSMILTGQIHLVVRPVLNTDKLDQIIYECGRIGNNINQISKYLNSGNPITAKLIRQLHHELADLAKIRKRIEHMEEGISGNIKAYSE